MDKYYKLAAGTQVREEDFGLLFYQMVGPRLHFVATGNLLKEDFFLGEMSVGEWIGTMTGNQQKNEREAKAVAKALRRLVVKGVVVEC